MTKKGKFQLLSYLLDENLIYYKSLNKNKKIIAFAMFETAIVEPVISILNQYLRKRFLHYFTIQLNTLEKDKRIFLLNFEEKEKNSVIKIYNELEQNLVSSCQKVTFFKSSELEWKFLEPVLKKSNSNPSLLKQNSSILVLNHSNSFLINIYKVNLNYLEDLESFFNNFLKVINSFNRIGYLIFNFRIDNNDEIIFSPFFAEKCRKGDEPFNTENYINTFFNYTMLKRQDIKIKQIFNYLWRLGISDDNLPLKNFNKLFKIKDQSTLIKLLQFNKRFEQDLLKNQIKFIRLGKNLLFIEDKFLFVVLMRLNSEYIQKIIEKYHSKYFIYITVLNEGDLRKLYDISKFSSLNNLRILNSKEILEFNYDRFRTINS